MIAVGDGGTLLDSPDDGQTWAKRSAPITLRALRVSLGVRAASLPRLQFC